MEKKNVAIIFSRMDSNRLPGKALKKIGNYSLLEHCIHRLAGSNVFTTIVATSSRKIDDPIFNLARKCGVLCFRGDAFDLNKRLLDCINELQIDAFARVNGDSPLVSKELIESGFNKLWSKNLDFVTNLVPRRFPYGVSVEVFNSAFYAKCISGLKNLEKENITKYFYTNLDLYNTGGLSYDSQANDHSICLTIDEEKDILFFKHLLTLDAKLFERSFKEVVSLIKKNKINTL